MLTHINDHTTEKNSQKTASDMTKENQIQFNSDFDSLNETNELDFIRYKLAINPETPVEISDPDESIVDLIPQGMVIPKIKTYRHIRIYKA